MSDPRAELERLLVNGPVRDIFHADEGRAIAQAIEGRRQVVNGTPFTRSFVVLQGYAIEQFVLATTRLFERPDKYELMSLPAVIKYLESQAATLHILEPNLLRKPLELINAWSSDFASMKLPDTTLGIARALSSRMPKPSKIPALKQLKIVRDSFLAHRENYVMPVQGTAWKDTDEMFRFARCAVSAIGGGYLATAFCYEDGSYALSSDATMASNSVEQLIEHVASTYVR